MQSKSVLMNLFAPILSPSFNQILTLTVHFKFAKIHRGLEKAEDFNMTSIITSHIIAAHWTCQSKWKESVPVLCRHVINTRLAKYLVKNAHLKAACTVGVGGRNSRNICLELCHVQPQHFQQTKREMVPVVSHELSS